MQKRIAHYELSAYFFGDPGGIRTPDPRLRRNKNKFIYNTNFIFRIYIALNTILSIYIL